jgi:hypothetical protein
MFKVNTYGLAPNGFQSREYYSQTDAIISAEIDHKAGADIVDIFEDGEIMVTYTN